MKLKSQPKKRDLPENTITLINVVFLMLIFFLVVGTVATPLSEHILPAQTKERPIVPPHPNIVEIARDGKIDYRKEPTSLDQLIVILSSELEGNSDTKPVIKLVAHKELDADRLIEILEAMTSGGVQNIRLVTVDNGADE